MYMYVPTKWIKSILLYRVGDSLWEKKKLYDILSSNFKNSFGLQHRLSQGPSTTTGRRSTNSKRVHAARHQVENMLQGL